MTISPDDARFLEQFKESVADHGGVPGNDCARLLRIVDGLREEVNDAGSYVAEVALGVTHYPHGDGEPCVRCERDAIKSKLADAEARIKEIEKDVRQERMERDLE